MEISFETLNHISQLSREAREESLPHVGSVPLEEFNEKRSGSKTTELHHTLLGLSENQIRELAAVVWLGRNDFDTYERALAHASALKLQEAAEYLSDKPLFDYIPAGVKAITNDSTEDKTQIRSMDGDAPVKDEFGEY